ncbi:hypothetical protein SteCoe_13665 [Stentor coeruleus]|uniref:RING-type domain-containing protein n=1 Tax=Stentor coeruleus TaxID=5963 RepID=A0A1R2C7Y9_9CILI|nr:hypothetical protein SteCoe_13665 [Stentor coeruleus]
MQTTCLYCLETFNSSDKKPFKLECNHTFCDSCIKQLKLYLFPQVCPIDNIKVDFSKLQLCENILNHINSICSLHSLELTILCKNHHILLCSICAQTHSGCLIVEGKYEKLKENISSTISQSRTKAHQLSLDSIQFSNCCHQDDFQWLLHDCQESSSKYQLMLDTQLSKDLNIKENSNEIQSSYEYILSLIPDKYKRSTPLVSKSSKESKISNEVIPLVSKSSKESKISNESFLPFFTEEEKALAFLNLKSNGIVAFNEEYIAGCCIVHREINMIRNEGYESMKYFKVAKIHKETEKAFIVFFENCQKIPWILYGVGIGRPADDSGYVYIRELSVSFEGKMTTYNDFSIEYDPKQITKLFFLTEIIFMPSSSSVNIFIDISGKNHYMFCVPVLDNYVRPLDANNEVYNHDFPILHLLIGTNI